MRTIIAMCTMIVSLGLAGLAASSLATAFPMPLTRGAGGCRVWRSCMPDRLRYGVQRS